MTDAITVTFRTTFKIRNPKRNWYQIIALNTGCSDTTPGSPAFFDPSDPRATSVVVNVKHRSAKGSRVTATLRPQNDPNVALRYGAGKTANKWCAGSMKVSLVVHDARDGGGDGGSGIALTGSHPSGESAAFDRTVTLTEP